MQYGTRFYSFQCLVSLDERGWAAGDVKTAACTYNDSSSIFIHDECKDCLHGDVEGIHLLFLQFLELSSATL